MSSLCPSAVESALLHALGDPAWKVPVRSNAVRALGRIAAGAPADGPGS